MKNSIRFIFILHCGLLCTDILCSDNKNNTRPSHYGAARQMFGSASLRPKESKTVYAIGRKSHGERSTISPPYYKELPFMPHFPLGYIPLPEVIGGSRSTSRSAMRNNKGQYGGRPEYPNGRPNHGILGGKFPFDLGLLPGHGFENPKQLLQLGTDGIDYIGQRFEHLCGPGCRRGEYLCIASCICIPVQNRCDGVQDCDSNEDELECGEMELLQHTKCDEINNNNVRCPRTKKCILRDWLCDGDDDCGDFSDETRCGFAVNCTSEQFECANGMCIPKKWVCDNTIDCKDFSDEMNCTKTGCGGDEFECGDESCITKLWKCDGQLDCSDGSDENDCPISTSECLISEFECSNQKCIKSSFKCDSDNDCGDWSDEKDCDALHEKCVEGEFRCNNGKCIPQRYRCDKQQDCENNEDEKNCDYSIVKPCSPDEFKCRSGACILKTWVCDGFRDCSEEEDESDCEIVCDDSKFPCTYPDPMDNRTEFCIHRKHVCDNHKDCPKGEDEIACPTKRDCEKHTNCTQLCITTHEGKPACSCLPGYTLAKDSITCEDINECLYATDPVCSQKCTNSKGSFKCSCLTGYILRPDLRSCKALGAPPTLLFANRKDIRQVSLSNVKYTAIIKGLQNAIALDYHYNKKYVFWSDTSIDVITRANLNGSGAIDIVKAGLESPGGLALDWIHNLIFWTDSGTRRIELATLDGLNRAIVAANDIDKPRAIVVHPGYALVFWTDWGPNPKIERAEMDGRNRKSIVTESVFWPNGLAIDYISNKIYWADAKHNVIESAFFDGSGRKKVISKGLPHPFAITIFEDLIYWTDWHTKSISSASKSTGAGLKIVHSQLYFPMDIHCFHPQRQPKFENHCGKNNGGCEHMCVPNNDSYTCMCRFGQKLASNRKSCLQSDKFLIFTRKKDVRIQHLEDDAVHHHDIVVPLEGIKSLSAFAWHGKYDWIYWTDTEKKTINRAFWNGSHQEVIIDTNLEMPSGVAVDWITDKLYWTDAETNYIEVSGLNGEHRSLLIWEGLDQPKDIVVDPLSGHMFWISWGKQPKIERAGMDGSERIVIINDKIFWPNSLAIDYTNSLLYWTDSGSKSISCSLFDGTKRKIILEGNSLPHPYGVDVTEEFIFWTDWQNLTVEKANKKDGSGRQIEKRKVSDVRQVKVFMKKQKSIKKACQNKNGGCSHLCLLRPKGHSCACPTGIKLEDDLRTCEKGPMNYLLMANRNVIRQISLDVPYMADVVLPIQPLKMANSLDVDRKTGEIYWTDTTEDVIKKVRPDGTELSVVLMHEILMPDGIAVDSTGRKIYWTDGDRNSIEVSELDGTNRKVLFCAELNKPRAIALHYHLGLLFWSDWGDEPKIEVAEMDGSNRKTLISEDLQWPNGLATDRPGGRLYWDDGKLAKIESCTLDGKDRKTIIKDLSHPYGLVVVGNHIYWTDWQTQALHRADKITGKDKKIIRGKLEGLMDVRAVQSDNIAENVCGKNNGGCTHLCLRNSKGYSCQCPTGLLRNGTTCNTLPSTFLLVAGGLYITRISFDTPEIWDYTLPTKTFKNLVALDFHWEKKLIFYTDLELNAIKSMEFEDFNALTADELSDDKDVVTKDLESPDDIAVDWIADNIYWTNTKKNKIEVSRLDGTHRKTVVDQIKDPRAIVVYPRKGFLFWTDWGDSKIEKSLLDGSNRKVLFDDHLMFPIGLTIDYKNKRLYWVDAKPGGEKIETSTLYGDNRFTLDAQNINPFSLTLFGEYVYWSDWKEKAIFKANKTSGINKKIVRPFLDEAMGIVMVSKERQKGWNPCAVRNGRCKYLCFFLGTNYTCGCPDSEPHCDKDLKTVVPNKCIPGQFDCDYENEEPDDVSSTFYNPLLKSFNNVSNHPDPAQDQTFYLLSVVLMICIILLCVSFVVVLCVLKGKKNFGYGNGGSFTNPNYYSTGGEAVNPGERGRHTIWKKFKYDRSEDRVYDSPETNSPEAANLIPMILTPCSSNCEVITSDIERSPSATPLYDLTRSPIV